MLLAAGSPSNLNKMLLLEVVGDVGKVELGAFLAQLRAAEDFDIPEGAGTTAGEPSARLAGEEAWGRRIADPAALARIYETYGGYIPHLRSLRQAQVQRGKVDGACCCYIALAACISFVFALLITLALYLPPAPSPPPCYSFADCPGPSSILRRRLGGEGG